MTRRAKPLPRASFEAATNFKKSPFITIHKHAPSPRLSPLRPASLRFFAVEPASEQGLKLSGEVHMALVDAVEEPGAGDLCHARAVRGRGDGGRCDRSDCEVRAPPVGSVDIGLGFDVAAMLQAAADGNVAITRSPRCHPWRMYGTAALSHPQHVSNSRTQVVCRHIAR